MIELRPDDGKPLVGKYKWLGGAVARDGNVYCVPSDSTEILKIEAATNRVIVFGRWLPPDQKSQSKVPIWGVAPLDQTPKQLNLKISNPNLNPTPTPAPTALLNC